VACSVNAALAFHIAMFPSRHPQRYLASSYFLLAGLAAWAQTPRPQPGQGGGFFGIPTTPVAGPAQTQPAGSGFKVNQAAVRTALLAAKPAPGVAGAAVAAQVQLAVVAQAPVAGNEITLRGTVPAPAQAALRGVSEFLKNRHLGWPRGQRVEVAIAGAAAAADLASSSLAVAVAADAMLAGWRPDPNVAVIGAIAPDGQLEPVGTPIPRLLAALRGGATRVVMPEKMFAQVTDVLVSEGVAAFAKMQIFTLNSFEDAPGIVSQTPAREVVLADQRFAEVRAALDAAGADADAALKQEDVKEMLREVLVAAPTHMTARLLLGRTTGQYTRLSVEGSLTALEAVAQTLLKAARSKSPADLANLPLAQTQAEAARLKAAEGRFDVKARPLVDALITYAEAAAAWHARPAQTAANQAERYRMLSAASRQVLAEWRTLAPSS
jgi:hypothetical protein